MNGARMLGIAAGDPHKNTANSGRVNDRDRRRRKRIEKAVWLKTETRG